MRYSSTSLKILIYLKISITQIQKKILYLKLYTNNLLSLTSILFFKTIQIQIIHHVTFSFKKYSIDA